MTENKGPERKRTFNLVGERGVSKFFLFTSILDSAVNESAMFPHLFVVKQM